MLRKAWHVTLLLLMSLGLLAATLACDRRVEAPSAAPPAAKLSTPSPTAKPTQPPPKSPLDRILAEDRLCPMRLDLWPLYDPRGSAGQAIDRSDAPWLFARAQGSDESRRRAYDLEPLCKLQSTEKFLSLMFYANYDYHQGIHVLTFARSEGALSLVSSLELVSLGGDAEDYGSTSALWVGPLSFEITEEVGTSSFEETRVEVSRRSRALVSINPDTGLITREPAPVWYIDEPTTLPPLPRLQALPPAVLAALSAKNLDITHFLNPFYLRGDFNADGLPDTAVLVEKSDGRTRGIAIIHGGDGRVHVMGAGETLGAGGSDFGWMLMWRVYPKGPIPRSSDGTPPRSLISEAIHVSRYNHEANDGYAGALIYWDGDRYQWFQPYFLSDLP